MKGIQGRKGYVLCFFMTWVMIMGIFAVAHRGKAMEKVSLNKTNVTISVGEGLQLNLQGTDAVVVWASEKPSVAKVSDSGKVVGKKKGTTIITATVNGMTYSCKVKVKKGGKASEITKLVNGERKKRGKKALTMDAKLNKAAKKRAKEIASKFDHTRPDGTDCFTVLDEYGISYMAVGENIAAGQKDAKAAVKAWMNSPGHRRNILDKGYGRIGVGYYKSESGPYKHFWVQIFAD